MITLENGFRAFAGIDEVKEIRNGKYADPFVRFRNCDMFIIYNKDGYDYLRNQVQPTIVDDALLEGLDTVENMTCFPIILLYAERENVFVFVDNSLVERAILDKIGE